MYILKKLWKKIKVAFSYLKIIYKFPLYIEQNKFILYEIRRLNELMRFNAVEDKSIIKQDTVGQTCSSFDYQWRDFNYGIAMPDDTVKEISFCTMNSIHRPHIEKQVAKKITAKVRNEFDTNTGQKSAEATQEVARNGGIKKESDN